MLDPEICYRALGSRDPRFDGRFFTGVVTTGIYCRPVCPAQTPRRRNCRFFPCAAAAQEAGFRPCLRCRPEASPGTPAWVGTSTTVSRALRLIAEGALDGPGVDELATRLGVGARHLRRLFADHLGASPITVAQTRRVHFAKRLIDETRLPMAQVAFNAGFRSVRRFNAVIQRTYRRSPTDLRLNAGDRPMEPRDADLLLRLAYRAPFDWRSLVAFLRPRATPGVEAIDGGSYRRTVAFGDAKGIIEVRPVARRSQLLLRVPSALSGELMQIVARIRDLFDLDADPEEIAGHLSRDPRLARLVRGHPGLRVPGAWDRFELAVRAVLGQQVTVRGATTLAGRIVREFGERLSGDAPGPCWIFPGPEVLAAADLRSMGLPRNRAEAIRELANAVGEGRLTLDPSAGLEVAVSDLTKIPGVGAWTAHYIAMRALRESDAFPSGDLGLRRALSNGSKPATPAVVSSWAESWRPWRAYAAMHLWRHESAGRPKEKMP